MMSQVHKKLIKLFERAEYDGPEAMADEIYKHWLQDDEEIEKVCDSTISGLEENEQCNDEDDEEFDVLTGEDEE